MHESQAQRFGHNLGGRCSAEELAAAAGRSAGAAAQFGGLFHCDFAVGEAGADGLYFAGVLAVAGGKGYAAGHDHNRQFALRREGDHHRRQTLVASADAHDPLSCRQRPDQAAQDDGGVVSVGQRVHHPGRALRTAITGVGHEAGKRHHSQLFEPRGRGLHQQADLPVAGMVAESDRRAVRRADAALCAENEELGIAQAAGAPAHAGVLREAEDVAAGRVAQELFVQWQGAGGADGMGLDVEKAAFVVVYRDVAGTLGGHGHISFAEKSSSYLHTFLYSFACSL